MFPGAEHVSSFDEDESYQLSSGSSQYFVMLHTS